MMRKRAMLPQLRPSPRAAFARIENGSTMKRYFRFVLLALVLLTVAMVSALTAMRFAIHGREVAVPNLVGMTRAAAETSANASGLILDVENKFFSSDIAEGKIL